MKIQKRFGDLVYNPIDDTIDFLTKYKGQNIQLHIQAPTKVKGLIATRQIKESEILDLDNTEVEIEIALPVKITLYKKKVIEREVPVDAEIDEDGKIVEKS